MDKDQLLVQLNIRIGDTDNFTYTIEEKQDALAEAMNDDSVREELWGSFTYSVGTYEYDKPTDMSVVDDLYIKRDNNSDEPEKIDSNLWEVVGNKIHTKNARQYIPDGYTIYVKGWKKLNDNSTVTDVHLQNYILNFAQLKLLRMLGVKKSLRFLKNDTSMSEIIAIKRELEAEVREYRRGLPTNWQVS